MIREALDHFQISPNLTDNIMQEISRLKPSLPISKPLVPWVLGAASTVLIMLMLGIGSQYLTHFQKPYSLDAQTERMVEIVDAQIVQNVDAKPVVRNQLEERSDTNGRGDGNGKETNQVLGDEDDYTRWNLPEGAKRRLGKGVLTDMKLSPDDTRIAISSSTGIWLYDVNNKPTSDTNQEKKSSAIARFTSHKGVVKQLTFSPDSKLFASIGNDTTIRLWETSKGKHLFTLITPNPTGHFRSVKFLSDRKTLVGRCWDDYRIYFWDVTTGKYIKSYRPKLPRIRLGQDRNWQFATDTFFDHIGNIKFAVGNRDGTISIQNGLTGKAIIRLVGQSDETLYFNVDSEHNSLKPRKPTIKRSLVRPDDNPSNPRQRKTDGTPYPIQYLLSHPNQSSSIFEKQPAKWIIALDFSPDGKTIVSRSQYRVAHESGFSYSGGPTEIWDVATGEQLASLPLHVTDVKFSGDGKTFAIFGNGGVSVWDVASQQEIGIFNGNVQVTFSGDGKALCIIENGKYTLWDIATRSEISSLSVEPNPFVPLADRFELSYDGTLLASTGKNGTLNVWETKNSTQIRTLTTGYTDSFTALTFSSDSKTLVSGSYAGIIEFWDINTGKTPFMIKAAKRPIGRLFFPTKDATTLTVMSNSDLMRWNITEKIPVDAYTVLNARNWSGGASMNDGTSMRVKALTFTPDGERLATMNLKTNMIDVWNITAGKNPQHITVIEYKRDRNRGIALSPDGSTLAQTSQSDNGVDLWNADTGKLITKLNIPKKMFDKNNNISALAFSHDGNILVGGTYKNEIHIWDFRNYEHIGILKKHKHLVCTLVFSLDNTILASGDTGGGICLWKFSDRALLSTYKSPGGYVNELAFAPDGKTLASTNGARASSQTPGGTIFLWDVPSK